MLWLLVVYAASGKTRYLNAASGTIGLAVGIKATAVLLVVPAFTAVLGYELTRASRMEVGYGRRLLRVWIVPSLWAL